jgi:hypothetical protein
LTGQPTSFHGHHCLQSSSPVRTAKAPEKKVEIRVSGSVAEINEHTSGHPVVTLHAGGDNRAHMLLTDNQRSDALRCQRSPLLLARGCYGNADGGQRRVIVERLSFGVLGHAESAPQQVKIGHLRRVLDLSVEILEHSRARGNVSDANYLIDISIEAIPAGLLQNRS